MFKRGPYLSQMYCTSQLFRLPQVCCMLQRLDLQLPACKDGSIARGFVRARGWKESQIKAWMQCHRSCTYKKIFSKQAWSLAVISVQRAHCFSHSRNESGASFQASAQRSQVVPLPLLDHHIASRWSSKYRSSRRRRQVEATGVCEVRRPCPLPSATTSQPLYVVNPVHGLCSCYVGERQNGKCLVCSHLLTRVLRLLIDVLSALSQAASKGDVRSFRRRIIAFLQHIHA